MAFVTLLMKRFGCLTAVHLWMPWNKTTKNISCITLK